MYLNVAFNGGLFHSHSQTAPPQQGGRRGQVLKRDGRDGRRDAESVSHSSSWFPKTGSSPSYPIRDAVPGPSRPHWGPSSISHHTCAFLCDKTDHTPSPTVSVWGQGLTCNYFLYSVQSTVLNESMLKIWLTTHRPWNAT